MKLVSRHLKLFALGVCSLLAACSSIGERTVFSVGYYTVAGESFQELDQEIKLHGPNVTGVGKALASTDLRMLPNIRYDNSNNICRVDNASVLINARVTLPRHRDETQLRAELARAWDNLQEYAKAHEAVHLLIADRYALLMEQEIRALPPKPDCKQMRRDVQVAFTHLFRLHHAEQLQFDEEEKQRIRALSAQARTNPAPTN